MELTPRVDESARCISFAAPPYSTCCTTEFGCLASLGSVWAFLVYRSIGSYLAPWANSVLLHLNPINQFPLLLLVSMPLLPLPMFTFFPRNIIPFTPQIHSIVSAHHKRIILLPLMRDNPTIHGALKILRYATDDNTVCVWCAAGVDLSGGQDGEF